MAVKSYYKEGLGGEGKGKAEIGLNAVQEYSLKIREETKFPLDNVPAGGVKPNLGVSVKD